MKILNKDLPLHLQGQNAAEYVHDTTRYSTANFKMRLRSGKTMDSKDWARMVDDTMASVLGLNTLGMELDRLYNPGTIERKGKNDRRKSVKPLNTTFYDCGYVCKVTWSDGTITTVKWDGEGEFSENLAIAIAFIKKTCGLQMYDDLLASVDKFEDDKFEATLKKQALLDEAEEKRAKAYRKAVKAAARRKRKREQFMADVKSEMNNQFE